MSIGSQISWAQPMVARAAAPEPDLLTPCRGAAWPQYAGGHHGEPYPGEDSPNPDPCLATRNTSYDGTKPRNGKPRTPKPGAAE